MTLAEMLRNLCEQSAEHVDPTYQDLTQCRDAAEALEARVAELEAALGEVRAECEECPGYDENPAQSILAILKKHGVSA